MFLSFYGLSRSPFESEPSVFFEAPGHADAFWGLIYGITENRGFIALGGAPGAGKTATLEAAIRSLEITHPSLIWIRFEDPWLSAEVILATIADRLNLATALLVDGDLGPVRNRLVRLKDSGKTVILVVDKAENLDVRALKLINHLATFGDEEVPLFLTIFLCEPSVYALLNRPEAGAIDRRVAVRIDIPALPARIARSYVAFRLDAAGGSPRAIMTASAVRALVRYGEGNPLRIGHLGDRVLSYGFARNLRPITAGTVKAALSRPRTDDGGTQGARIRNVVTGAIVALTAVVAASVLLTIHHGRPPSLSPPLGVATPIMPIAQPAPRVAIIAKPQPTVIAHPEPVVAAKSAPSAPVTSAPVTSAPVKSAPVKSALVKPASNTIAVIVRPGDTILSILRRASLPATDAELREIHAINSSLADSNLIFPGQTIFIPGHRPQGQR